MTIQVNITQTGRMSLPADIRNRLGLSGGGTMLLEARAHAITKQFTMGKADASVDAFLANRLTESGA